MNEQSSGRELRSISTALCYEFIELFSPSSQLLFSSSLAFHRSTFSLLLALSHSCRKKGKEKIVRYSFPSLLYLQKEVCERKIEELVNKEEERKLEE